MAFDMQHLIDQYQPVRQLVSGGAFVIGMGLVAGSVLKLRQAGQNAQHHHGGWGAPLSGMVAGSMLLYLPSALDSMMMTTFGNTSVLSYSGGALPEQSAMVMKAVVGFIQLVGLIAFIRGWMLVRKAGDSNNQNGEIGRGITHIVGGVLTINLVATVQMFGATLGLPVSLLGFG